MFFNLLCNYNLSYFLFYTIILCVWCHLYFGYGWVIWNVCVRGFWRHILFYTLLVHLVAKLRCYHEFQESRVPDRKFEIVQEVKRRVAFKSQNFPTVIFVLICFQFRQYSINTRQNSSTRMSIRRFNYVDLMKAGCHLRPSFDIISRFYTQHCYCD